MYIENYKTLLKEIPCSWIGRLVQMAMLPKVFYRFNTIHIKILMAFFCRNVKSILKFIWNCKKPQIAKTILKKEQSWRTNNS